MRSLLLKLLFLFLLLSQTNLFAQQNWKLESEKGGMKVFTRMNSDSPIKELKIEVEIDASLSQLVALLNDVDYYTNWVYNCNIANFVEKVAEGEFYYYVEMDLPWPLSNRDLVQHCMQSQDTSTLVVEMHTLTEKTDEKFKKNESNVRITKGYILWRLSPISVNKTHVYYHLKTDPGGNLPAWLFNMVIELAPTNTMNSLKQAVKLSKYQKGSDYIINYLD